MILYANQFPVDPSFTKERFVRQVIDWKQGARYDTFRNLEWDGIHYRLSWKEEKKLLSIEDFPEFGAVSAEFRKEDEYGVWITEFTLNYAEHYLSCRLRREVTEYTSDFNPQARPPVFGKLVIRDGYGGKDDILQVTPDVIPLGEEKLSLLRHMAAREMELMLPVVIVTRMEDGKLPLDSTELAKELQGSAHILEEERTGLLSGIAFAEGQENVPGQILVFFPNQAMRTRFFNLSGGPVEDGELLTRRICEAVYSYLNLVRWRDVDFWDGLWKCRLHEENIALLKEGETMFEDMAENEQVLTERLKELQKKYDNLFDSLQEAKGRLQKYETKVSPEGSTPLLWRGDEIDIYEGEVREIVLDILDKSLKNIPENSRRYHIVKDLLAKNEWEHLPAKRREELKRILKDYRVLDKSSRSDLLKLNIKVTDGGKHYKWHYGKDRRYTETAPKTSSDVRVGKNMASQLSNGWF